MYDLVLYWQMLHISIPLALSPEWIESGRNSGRDILFYPDTELVQRQVLKVLVNSSCRNIEILQVFGIRKVEIVFKFS